MILFYFTYFKREIKKVTIQLVRPDHIFNSCDPHNNTVMILHTHSVSQPPKMTTSYENSNPSSRDPHLLCL